MTIQEHLVTMASHNREILQTIREPNMQHDVDDGGDQTASEQTTATQSSSAGERGLEAQDSRLSDAGQSSQSTFGMTSLLVLIETP
jgi:hypothetical protein